MKSLAATLFISVASMSGASSFAAEGILLVSRDGKNMVVHATTTGFSDLTSVGDRPIYGESPGSIGLLSQRDQENSEFTVIDKTGPKVRTSWPVTGQAVTRLSGPSRDVVMTDGFAYFASLRVSPDGNDLLPNSAGGAFELNKFSLSDGRRQTWPMPAACANPRLANVTGTVFVYCWNGSDVWKLHDASGSFKRVVSASDFEDSQVIPNAGTPGQLDSPGKFADFIVLPDAGIFRVSRQGALQSVLQRDFSTLSGKPALSLTTEGNRVLRTFGGRMSGKPALGVLRQSQKGVTFSKIDPADSKVEWTIELPEAAVPDSLWLADDDSVLYVDRASASIVKASPSETREIWSLKAMGAGLNAYSTRILSLRNTK